MQGNIHIEVLNESAVMVATHLKGVSEIDKKALIMVLAEALHLTPVDILTTSLEYPRIPCHGQTRQNGFIEQSFHP